MKDLPYSVEIKVNLKVIEVFQHLVSLLVFRGTRLDDILGPVGNESHFLLQFRIEINPDYEKTFVTSDGTFGY